MTDPAVTLERVGVALTSTAPRGLLGHPEVMEDAARRVRELLNASRPVEVDTKRAEGAVRRLLAREKLTAADVRTCSAVANTTITIGTEEVRLVQQPDAIDFLVQEARRQRPRQFVRIAGAMAHAWFSSPTRTDTPGARKLVGAITEFAERADRLTASGAALLELKPVFERFDATPFVAYLRDLQPAAIAPLRTIAVPSSSWVWQEVARAGLDAASAEGDRAFRARVNDRLDLLREHPEQERLGVGLLLNRIASGSERKEMYRLRDKAVEVLGNPMQSNSDADWARWASPEARRMVVAWLTRQVVRTFFETLNGADSDPRRAAFWENYAEAIDELWIYVSEETRRREGQAVASMKQILGDHVRLLDELSMNVFAMRLTGHVFVEFSETSNAAYVYEHQALPPGFGTRQPSGPDFKDMALKERRILHQGSWEPKAELAIRILTGARPSAG